MCNVDVGGVCLPYVQCRYMKSKPQLSPCGNVKSMSPSNNDMILNNTLMYNVWSLNWVDVWGVHLLIIK